MDKEQPPKQPQPGPDGTARRKDEAEGPPPVVYLRAWRSRIAEQKTGDRRLRPRGEPMSLREMAEAFPPGTKLLRITLPDGRVYTPNGDYTLDGNNPLDGDDPP